MALKETNLENKIDPKKNSNLFVGNCFENEKNNNKLEHSGVFYLKALLTNKINDSKFDLDYKISE